MFVCLYLEIVRSVWPEGSVCAGRRKAARKDGLDWLDGNISQVRVNLTASSYRVAVGQFANERYWDKWVLKSASPSLVCH